jgi:hypothetical protein
LQPVDAQPQRGDAEVGQAQQFGILLAGGEHGLVAAQVERDGILGQMDAVGVGEFGPDLWYGPVSGEAAVADEAEDVPADEPSGQGEGEFVRRADGAGAAGAVGVSALPDAAAELGGASQGVDAAVAVRACVQRPATAGTLPLWRVEDDTTEDRTLRPTETHRPAPGNGSGCAHHSPTIAGV